MTSQMIAATEYLTILAANVSEDEYMEKYAELGCEWIEGTVVQMSPIELKHDYISKYLVLLLQNYFTLNSIGQIVTEPFVMRLPQFPHRRRQPDIMVILDTNPHLKNTYLDGPANICIEVISVATANTDFVDKFNEYETGGVSEYWIVDALHNECHFHRLNEHGRYEQQAETTQNIYTTPLLPRLRLHTPPIWVAQRPNTIEMLEYVRAMFADENSQPE